MDVVGDVVLTRSKIFSTEAFEKLNSIIVKATGPVELRGASIFREDVDPEQCHALVASVGFRPAKQRPSNPTSAVLGKDD